MRETMQAHKKYARTISRGGGATAPPNGFGGGASTGRMAKGAKTKAKGPDAPLVERLHSMHDQRKEQMDAVREEVFRQRQQKEDEEIRQASAFRAKPIKYKKKPSQTEKVELASHVARIGSPSLRGLMGTARGPPSSPAAALFVNEAIDRLCAGLDSKAAAEEAFRKIDKDNSGTLDTREFKLAMKALNLRLTNRQTIHLMKHLDTDGDGSVSIEEFMAAVWEGKLQRIRKKFQTVSYAAGGQDWAKLFAHYDRDNSGELDFEEFRRAVRKDVGMKKNQVTDEELREIFDQADTDGGGTISLAEFADMFVGQHRATQVVTAAHFRHNSVAGQLFQRILEHADAKNASLTQLFHRFDKDDTGGLDREAFRQAMLDIGIVLDKQEIREVFQDCDQDGDGFISHKEFADRMRLARKDSREKLSMEGLGLDPTEAMKVYEKEKKTQVVERRKAKSRGRIETASPRETQAQALFAKVTPVIQQTDAQTRVRQMETALEEARSAEEVLGATLIIQKWHRNRQARSVTRSIVQAANDRLREMEGQLDAARRGQLGSSNSMESELAAAVAANREALEALRTNEAVFRDGLMSPEASLGAGNECSPPRPRDPEKAWGVPAALGLAGSDTLERFQLTITASTPWVSDGTVVSVEANDLQTMELSLGNQLRVENLRVLAWDDDLEDFCVPDSIAEVGPVATIAVCPGPALEDQFGESTEASLTLAEARRSAVEEERRQFAWHSSSSPSSGAAPDTAEESPGARFERLTASANRIHAQLDADLADEQDEEEDEDEEDEEYVAPMMSKAELIAKAERQQQKRARRSYNISLTASPTSRLDYLQVIDEEDNEDDDDIPEDYVRLRVPDGMSPGDVIYVGTPDGREIVVQVPDAKAEGDEFDVSVGENAITVDEWEQMQAQAAQLAEDSTATNAAGKEAAPAPADGVETVLLQCSTGASDPEREHILRLICPDGVASGDSLTFEGPDGQELTCEVPEGVEPGMEFEIEVSELELAIRAELSQLKLTALMKRATASGATEEELEAAEEEDNHKQAVVELIVAKETAGPEPESMSEFEVALREELSNLKLTGLMMRATAAGATEDELEATEEEDNHKQAVVELVVAKETAESKSASPSREPEPEPADDDWLVADPDEPSMFDAEPEPEPELEPEPEPELEEEDDALAPPPPEPAGPPPPEDENEESDAVVKSDEDDVDLDDLADLLDADSIEPHVEHWRSHTQKVALTKPGVDDRPWLMDLAPHDFLYECEAWLLELGALTTDGIFRVAGSNDTVTAMKKAMQDGEPARDVIRSSSDVHDLSTCLGRWLREEPAMVPASAFAQIDALAAADGAACEAFMAGLPEPGQALLRTLIALLQEVDGDATRMTADNLSRVFALTIIKREDPMDMAKHVATDAFFVSLLIQKLSHDEAAEEHLEEEWRLIAEARRVVAEEEGKVAAAHRSIKPHAEHWRSRSKSASPTREPEPAAPASARPQQIPEPQEEEDDEDAFDAGPEKTAEELDDEFGVMLDGKEFKVSKTESMGAVKRRMSVETGLSPDQMAKLLGVDDSNDDQTVAEIGVLTEDTVIQLPEQKGMVDCQFKGKGKFISMHLTLEKGQLKFESDRGAKTLRTATAIGCKVDVPKKARKGHEHAFRVDLAKSDSEKCLKYVISVSNARELKSWMDCFGTYSSMTADDVAKVEAEAAEAAAKLLRMSRTALPYADSDESDEDDAAGISIKVQAAADAESQVAVMQIPEGLFDDVSFSGCRFEKRKVKISIGTAGLDVDEEGGKKDGQAVLSHGLDDLFTWSTVGSKKKRTTLEVTTKPTAGATTLEFESKDAVSIERSLTEAADAVASWKDGKQKGLAAQAEAKALAARKKTKPPLAEFAAKKAGQKLGPSTAKAPAPEPNPEPEPAAPDSMAVICPDGVGSGDWIVVDTPDGRELEAQVPPNIHPGEEFSVALPPPPSPRLTTSNPGRMVTAIHTWDTAAGADADAGDLVFEAGTQVEIVSESEPGHGWITGRTPDGVEGIFPANYI